MTLIDEPTDVSVKDWFLVSGFLFLTLMIGFVLGLVVS